MQKSEEIGELAKALSQFQAEVPQITFNSNVEYKLRSGGSKEFAYADLAGITNTIKNTGTKHGLSHTQLVDTNEQGHAVINTMLMHSSGEWIMSSTLYSAAGSAQDQGSYITYMRRYSLAAIYGVVAEKDDDGQRGAEGDAKGKEKQAEKAKENATLTNGKSFTAFLNEIQTIKDLTQLETRYAEFKGSTKLTKAQQTSVEKVYEIRKKSLGSSV